MLCFTDVILVSQDSSQLKVTMLVDFDLILIALNLIHHLLCGYRGLHDSVNIVFIVADHSIVMFS